MEWLNYHHLRYFWVVAREGGLRQAAAVLHVSQPSISEQIKELEAALGEPLFRRSGRTNVLTDAGQIAFRYAGEIFGLGAELVNAIKQRPGAAGLRLYAGISDAVPKLVAHEMFKPVLAGPNPVHIIGREGKLEDLLTQLAAHQLDIVLADEPAPSGLKFKAFSHFLGETGVSFCAAGRLAETLRRNFPHSLDQAPALMPTETSSLRRALDKWFKELQIAPRIVAEFDDAALMKVVAAEGNGFIPVPTVVLHEALTRYRYKVIGATDNCRDRFYAITAERRITHPAVATITRKAQAILAS